MRLKRLNVLFLILAALVGVGHAQAAKEEPILVIDPRGHSAMIKEVMFTQDGRRLISVSDDKTIRLWDVESGEIINTLRGQVGDGDEGRLYAGALSPDGRTLAVGGYFKNDEIRIFNIDTGEQTGLLLGHSNVIRALAFSADGRWLASGSVDKTVRIWNVSRDMSAGEKPSAVAVLEGHTDRVCGVAFSPDASKVVSASYDHTLRLWKKNSRGQFSSSDSIEIKKHNQVVRCVDWSPDGQYIVSGGFDDKILLWDGSGNFIKKIAQYSGDVATVSFSNDSKKVVASGAGSYEAFVYAIPSGDKISRFTGHNNSVAASAFFGSDLIATAGGDDNNIYLWDANTGVVKTHLVGKGKRVWAVAFGEGLQAAFGQGKSIVDDSNRGPLEKSFDFSRMSLDRETPATNLFTRTRTTYGGKTLKRLNDNELQVGDGITIKNDVGIDGRIRCYTFTNDGNIAVGSSYSLKLYGNNGSFVREFVGHIGEVWAVSVSGDGRILASASGDQTVKLWNIASGQLLATLFVAADNEWICWTPKGFYAASAGGEKYIGWQVNRGMDKTAEYYPVYSFRRQYHNPELVQRTIELFSFEKALAEYNAAPGRKIEAVAAPQSLPPSVLWLNPVTFSQKTNAGTLRIRAQITAEEKITDFKILVNGGTVAAKSDITVLSGASDTDKTIEYTVSLTPNENRITIFAAHRDASATSAERLVVYESTEWLKPNLYVVVIGISDYQKPELKLDFADDDARAVSDLFATQKGRLFKNVDIKPCINETAGRSNIIDALDWLNKKATQKDVVVVFIAGHGYMDRDNYYLLPYDGDPDNLRKTAVRWDDFVDILGNLPSRSLLFLDTCHSGGIDPNLLTGFRGGSPIDNTEAIRELASEEYGVVVMAASTGKELSMERKEWGHGAFTKALLEGLETTAADFSHDGIIHLNELNTYVSERVKTLTNGEQHPTTQMPVTISRFPIFQLKSRE